MNGQCCVQRPPSHQLARRFSHVTPSVVPAVLLLLLPKCPMCIAAWLTLATGLSVSASAAGWVRISLVLLWMLGLGQVVWRHARIRLDSSKAKGE